LRSHFNRSALVRQLSHWQAAPVDAPRQDVAVRLGDWLNVADAITLHSANRSIPGITTAASKLTNKTTDLSAECAQVRATLAKAITTRPFGQALEAATDFPIYHQRYLDHQRRMEMSIEALRAHVRQTLSQTSAVLAQLAALDAMLAQMLGGREQKLLSSVPTFLKARFKDLQASHDPAAAPDPLASDNGWLATFEQDFQQALLAELDLRLQPVIGMIEALGQETHAHATTTHA
jgi:hypothetical protein